jgi:alanyl-tRNA synthetase
MTQPNTIKKLYRNDSYLSEFNAIVLEVKVVAGNLEVVLDQTAFYPTAGGQPNDTGTLHNARVLDVRESKGESLITHVLEGEVSLEVGAEVSGVVDWQRRFDNMQQHTGEHMLGQAFFRLNAHVIAVNMERGICTLDLEQTMTEDMAIEAERICNQAIWAGHEITTYEVHDSEIRNVPLRRTPKVSGMIRVVQIGDYDYSACGGTHLRSSSEVGMVKILKLERIKSGATRVYFICGARCLSDYRFKHDFVSNLGLKFSTALENVPARTEALLEELGSSKKELSSLRTAHAELLAVSLLEKSFPVVVHTLDDAGLLVDLAKSIASRAKSVGILGAVDGTRVLLAVACGFDSLANANNVLRVGLPFVDGKGGGKPDMAQGSGTNPGGLSAALDAMAKSLR